MKTTQVRELRWRFGWHCCPAVVSCLLLGLVVGGVGFKYLFWSFGSLLFVLIAWTSIYRRFYKRKTTHYWFSVFALNLCSMLIVAFLG